MYLTVSLLWNLPVHQTKIGYCLKIENISFAPNNLNATSDFHQKTSDIKVLVKNIRFDVRVITLMQPATLGTLTHTGTLSLTTHCPTVQVSCHSTEKYIYHW